MIAREVTKDNPDLALRLINDSPVARWVCEFLPKDFRRNMPAFHLDLYDLITKELKAVVKAPRSFAKSVIISKNFPLYCICNYAEALENQNNGEPNIVQPHHRITLMSATGPLAKYWLDQIRTEIEENPLIKLFYGDLKGRIWNQDEIMTKRWDKEKKRLVDGIHIRAVGAGYQQRGWRPHLLICDDLDTDEEVLSDLQLQKYKDWWDTAVTNMLDEVDCQVFVMGTTLAEDSLLEHISEKADRDTGWSHWHFSAYEKDEFGVPIEEAGHELWPDKWPDERLKARQSEIGRRHFCAEFLNLPMSSESPLFYRDHFRHYNPNDFKKMFDNQECFTFTVIDPAVKKADGYDYSAVITGSCTLGEKPRIYIREVKQGHWLGPRQVTEVTKAALKYGSRQIGVEATAYQEVLTHYIDEWMDNTGHKLDVVCLRPHSDKETRALSVSGYVESGQVFIDGNDHEHRAMVDQCVRFKRGVKNIKKDKMDALVMLLYMVRERTRGSQHKGSKRVLPGDQHMSLYMGRPR